MSAFAAPQVNCNSSLCSVNARRLLLMMNCLCICKFSSVSSAFGREIFISASKHGLSLHLNQEVIFFYIYCFSQIQNIAAEDKTDLYYWAEIMGQHTQTLNIQQIPEPLMITGHVINCSSYLAFMVPHPSTILRG